jgi:pimeloyl-ACP methyl ester carboxylesterase
MEEAGHAVANVGYASLMRPLDTHVATTARVVAALAEDGAEEIHFVAHSLGGFVARRLSAEGLIGGARLGRIVLLAVPNGGAALADRLKDFPPYKAITGACGQAVTTRGASAVPIPNAEIFVVAGGNGKRGYNPMLPDDNDGIVTVAETRLGEAETDFLRVSCFHTSIMLSQTVIAATRIFIAAGEVAAGE